MTFTMRLLVLAICISATTGCGNKGPTSPGGTNAFVGTWNGTLTSATAGTMTIQWVVAQNVRQLTGNVTLTKGTFTTTGTISGSLENDAIPSRLGMLFNVGTPSTCNLVAGNGQGAGSEARPAQITATLTMDYRGCPQLTGSTGTVTESSQLTLTK